MEQATEDRFWNHVDIGGPNECWNWHSIHDGQGYGFFRIKGIRFLAHRIAWKLAHNQIPIPDKLCICHHCDNTSCVNPAHLFLGTVADNNDDMMRKGRHNFGGPVAYGEANASAKLNEAKVIEIRNLHSNGGISCRELGRQYSVSGEQIRRIVNRTNWQHI